MSAHSYIYVTIFYFLKMMLTYHISHENNFSTALYVPGRSGVNSPFYKQVLKSYLSTRSLDESPCLTVAEFLNQPLWGNNMFFIRRRRTNHPMYLSNYLKSGVIYVKDLDFNVKSIFIIV